MSTNILGSRMKDAPASQLSGRRGYGDNGNSFPASIKTTERTDTPALAQHPDSVLGEVAVHGCRTIKRTNAGDLKDRHAGKVPTTFGHKDPNRASEKVPGSAQFAAAQPVRKPTND